MRKLIILFFIVLLMAGCDKSCKYNSTLLQKPFMNHELPGDELQIFSPDLISSEHQEHSSLTISPDGKEIMWSRWHLPHDLDKYPQEIKYIKFEDGQWTQPETAPFSGKFRDGGPAFSPDGNKIYFYSRRPLDKNSKEMHDNDIWVAEKTETGWGEAQNLSSAVNSSMVEVTPCLAANGNLYFASNRAQYEDPTGNTDIFISEFVNGKFTDAKNIGSAINTDYARDAYPYIAPDESYLIFSRDSRRFDENRELIDGDRKMMISFRNKKGEWGNAIDIGPEFKNTRFPYVTPDGRYFIFTKYTEGNNEDFYWINAQFIKKLNN